MSELLRDRMLAQLTDDLRACQSTLNASVNDITRLAGENARLGDRIAELTKRIEHAGASSASATADLSADVSDLRDAIVELRKDIDARLAAEAAARAAADRENAAARGGGAAYQTVNAMVLRLLLYAAGAGVIAAVTWLLARHA